MKTKVPFLLALAAALPAAAATFDCETNIAYSGAAPVCRLDVKWPVGVTNFATVINLHGGGLVHGNRHYAPWPREAQDRDPVAHVAVTYRLLKPHSKEVGPDDPIADSAAAVAWTLRNIARYGGDPKKVFLTGISAGGYLTAMIGLDAKWLAPHGCRPADLAGCIPLTGQMTKHFNIRAVGFGDRDPQFAPKVDAYAPLFFAGSPDLPPFCFCTGGRDVEWKSRVEENELLAVSLRNCGYPRTEFHETEGDHGGGVEESTYFLRDFVMSQTEADGIARFRDGERVVFFGDSITHGGMYVFYLQLFQDLRRPGSGTRILNGGQSGDTAAGACRRWAQDVRTMRPDRIFAMFGMNDVDRDAYAAAQPSERDAARRARALDRYRASTRALADRLAKDGVKTVFMTPSPYNQYTTATACTNLVACNEPGLATCADIVRALAAERHLGLVDLHRPMTEMFRANPTTAFANDRVHPAAEGHLIMAAHVLDALGYAPVVARAVLDARKGRAVKIGRTGSRNCALTRVSGSANRLAFTYAPKALPFPKLPEYAAADGAFYPLTERFNQETIVVTGLAPGAYDLAFDGRAVGSFTSEQFAKGVNVALLDTTNQRRAQETAKIMRELQKISAQHRRYVLCENMLHEKKIDPNDKAASNAYLDQWLEKRKNNRYFASFRNWIVAYRTTDPKAALEEMENLYERMDAVRPAVSRVTVTPR